MDPPSPERVSLHTKPPSIDGAVKEIMAWNDVERRDNYEAPVEKNLPVGLTKPKPPRVLGDPIRLSLARVVF